MIFLTQKSTILGGEGTPTAVRESYGVRGTGHFSFSEG